MRKVLFGVACSLDGFIARSDHGVDWLHWSNDVSAIVSEYWKTIDTVVMGRKTWEVAARSGTPSYPGVKNYVVSGTLRDAPAGIEVVRDDPVEFVRRLKREEGAGICVMGGGQLGRALLDGGVIDTFGVNIHPVLLGSGIPLFPGAGIELPLELTECRRIAGGCVYLLYDVTPFS